MKKILTILSVLSFSALINAQTTVNLNATQNNYIVTMGGGQGKNCFLKFDITSIPSNAIITDVRFNAYIFDLQPSWDGDIRYIRYNQQTWVETDSVQDMWNTLLFTDTITQLGGFGMAVGFSQSPDLTSLFDLDFSILNSNFSLYLKDPDDPTFAPMSPGPTITNTDSLLVGNLFSDRIAFRPRLYSNINQRPYLTVIYGVPPATSIVGSGLFCIGDTLVVDSGLVTGSGPFTYQWFQDGAIIPGATNSTYTVNGLALSDSGVYELVISNAFGIDTSNQIIIDVANCPAGINESGNVNLFNIAPNPHNGNFNVVIKAISKQATMDIVNTLGEVIYTGKVGPNSDIQNIPLNITGQPNGIYYVRLYNAEMNHIEKTIKN